MVRVSMASQERASEREHVILESPGSSKVKVRDADGTIRSDPETAHKDAGDKGYKLRLPESCLLCWAAAQAEASEIEAQE